ncbi:MAG TPA: peptidoglycan DD-metalloendopeptidase family protein [Gaiellaceae bacterium]|nr:peptidoglycan DD-metalloendopeptidase family protein [Gaiellaceae bacterium]
MPPHALPLIRILAGALAALALLALAPAAEARGKPGRAALQVGLQAHGLYDGTINGRLNPGTRAGIRQLQRRSSLSVDGVPGPETRAALGAYGRHTLGKRTLRSGMQGWDAAALQFLLAWHGFPSGTLDGQLGPRTEAAVRRFQQWKGLRADGVVTRAVVRPLRTRSPRSPLKFRAPVQAPVADRFGPRGARFHAGIDFPAPAGTPIVAARAGTVTFAGWDSGGYGKLVVVAHTKGVTTWYAHLRGMRARPGQVVAAGERLGGVGATGLATGPHLHFEVRLRDAAVNPLPALR